MSAASTIARGAPSPRVARLFLIALLLLTWEILPRAGVIRPLFLPPLSTTVAALVGNLPEFLRHLLVTLKEVGISMIFACGGGIVAGLALGAAAKARVLLLPIFSGLFAVPLIVLYPLITAWFGIGSESKIVFASVYGFLPTLLGAAAGAQTLDRQYIVAARSMGATRVQQLFYIYLPGTLPTVLAAFRLGGALTIVGVVVAEMLVATAGVGFLISKYRTMLDSPNVYAAVILVLILAVAFDAAVQWVERRAVGWRQTRASAATRAPVS